MSPVAEMGLNLLWATVVAPMGTVVATSLVGRRLGRDLGGVSLVLGVIVGCVAVLGWPLPPQDAHHHVPLFVLAAGAVGVALDRREAAFPVVALLAAVALGVTFWRVLAPLAAIWHKGVAGPLATSAWVVTPALAGFVAWLGLDHAARSAPRPAVLAALVVALAAAAGVVALGGSARVGQAHGAIAAACGALLLGWRWPEVGLGHGGVAAVALALPALAVYAHFYADVPSPGLAVLLLAPLSALALVGVSSTLRGIALALVLAGLPAAGAGWLAVQAEAARAAAEKPMSDAEKDAADMYDMF